MRTRFVSRIIIVLVVGAGLLVPLAAQNYDLVIANGRVIDPESGLDGVRHLGVRAGKVVSISETPLAGQQQIDAKGLVVAPGFIDIHTHARRGIFEVPTADNYVRQGVTTLVEGPDGGSAVPLRPFLEKVAATRITPNFASFIGQGSIRAAVVGEDAHSWRRRGITTPRSSAARTASS